AKKKLSTTMGLYTATLDHVYSKCEGVTAETFAKKLEILSANPSFLLRILRTVQMQSTRLRLRHTMTTTLLVTKLAVPTIIGTTVSPTSLLLVELQLPFPQRLLLTSRLLALSTRPLVANN
ncbi:MAG: hypothetical protein IKJ02_06290, partial [Tidjanibacter sp.]|nr:hypothetical protein [Tidjanibacter sp.]